MDPNPTQLKAVAYQIVDALPENATWDDLMHRIHVRQCIEAGIADADEDRTMSVDQVRRFFALPH